MSDLQTIFTAQDHVKRWQAESENASARLELARHSERMAFLLSQHEPIHELGIDRNLLRLCFEYVKHGQLDRMKRDLCSLMEEKP